jgi:hypothetical protein
MCMRAEALRPRTRRRPRPREWSSGGFALGFGSKCLVRIVTGGRESDSGKQIKAPALHYFNATLARVRGRGRRRVRERRASTVNSQS